MRSRMVLPALPIELWLLVFDVIHDLDVLWSTVRNVSHYFRQIVDEYFCYGVIQQLLIQLYYSTINRSPRPPFAYVRIPLQFVALSEDRSRAIFRQVAYKEQTRSNAKGSVYGWVPFIERCCEETRRPKPNVTNPGSRQNGIPAWEKEYATLQNSLALPDKNSYFVKLRDHTSIGRGDRPPYFLRLNDYVHDTELVDLMVDCPSQISFDWRRTLSALFVEQHFLIVSARSAALYKPAYDESLSLAAARLGSQGYVRHTARYERRARRKRSLLWVARNRHRMTDEHRLLTEDRVELEVGNVRQYLHKDNLRDLDDGDVEEDEFVPDKCAKDHPELLLWPFIPTSVRSDIKCGLKCCTVL